MLGLINWVVGKLCNVRGRGLGHIVGRDKSKRMETFSFVRSFKKFVHGVAKWNRVGTSEVKVLGNTGEMRVGIADDRVVFKSRSFVIGVLVIVIATAIGSIVVGARVVVFIVGVIVVVRTLFSRVSGA